MRDWSASTGRPFLSTSLLTHHRSQYLRSLFTHLLPDLSFDGSFEAKRISRCGRTSKDCLAKAVDLTSGSLVIPMSGLAIHLWQASVTFFQSFSAAAVSSLYAWVDFTFKSAWWSSSTDSEDDRLARLDGPGSAEAG